jgi:hypothetical protein
MLLLGVVQWVSKTVQTERPVILPKATAMKYTRALGSLIASFLLAGCAASAPQAIVAFPGNDKSVAAFSRVRRFVSSARSRTLAMAYRSPAVQPADGNVVITTGGSAASPSPDPGATTGRPRSSSRIPPRCINGGWGGHGHGSWGGHGGWAGHGGGGHGGGGHGGGGH